KALAPGPIRRGGRPNRRTGRRMYWSPGRGRGPDSEPPAGGGGPPFAANSWARRTSRRLASATVCPADLSRNLREPLAMMKAFPRARWAALASILVLTFLSGGWLLRPRPAAEGGVYGQARLFEGVVGAINRHYIDSLGEGDLY